jgi:hypothetical protein
MVKWGMLMQTASYHPILITFVLDKVYKTWSILYGIVHYKGGSYEKRDSGQPWHALRHEMTDHDRKFQQIERSP